MLTTACSIVRGSLHAVGKHETALLKAGRERDKEKEREKNLE
jgi:hypothetical protein